MTIRFGVDRLVADPCLFGGWKRVGLVTNDAARLAGAAARYSRVALLEAGVPITRLFCPEHGLAAQAEDGASVANGVDPRTALPVHSLYGERLRPELASLQDLDAVLFDVPDVGTRFYTYTWTLFHVLSACAEARVPLVVLDRPNPLGGEMAHAEGPVLDAVCRSFVGEDAIPIRHQLSHGELAMLWQRERFAGARLEVVTCDGWQRALRWPQIGLPWIPTSPAMPSFESAQVYAGTCFFEATNLSVGRGTSAPFQHVGAPWLDVGAVLADLARRVPKGAEFSEVDFVPLSGPYAGERCRGVHVTVTVPAAFRPVSTGFLLLAAIASTHRLRLQWTRYPTAANPSGEGHFERLVGRRGIRRYFDASPQEIDSARVWSWTDTGGWAARVAAVLLYE